MSSRPDSRPVPTHVVMASGRFADHEAREVMSPGVTCISEDSMLHDVERAMVGRGVHAILVVGRHNGTPLGWVTSRGLLACFDRDRSLTSVREAVVETVTWISPSAPAREALRALSEPGVSHLLVARGEGSWPLGVISDVDLVGLAAR